MRSIAALAIILTSVVIDMSTSPGTADAQGGLVLVPLVEGLASPVQVTNAGDGTNRLFVLERPGRVRVIVDGDLLATPFLDLTDRVQSDDGEQGLLSIAFHPDYETNGEFFVYYTDDDWANTVERFHVSADPNRADRESGEVVLAVPDRAPNHNGGTLTFGPDGMLYLSTGDEGGAGDTYQNAQNLASLFGKILRLNIDAGDPYAIPPDNPFVGVPNARPEIWSYGLRNPWRISFDRATGDLWIADVGQATWEEVNVVPAGTGAGSNFGWNVMEGMHCYAGGCDPSRYSLPVAEYDHDAGCSITGGYVYRGQVYRSLSGRYFFGDYCSGSIWSLTQENDGDWSIALELESGASISSFGEDESGELYLVDLEGAVYRVTTTENPPPTIGDPAFIRTWARTDEPVAALEVDRTWMWGPTPDTDAISEPYLESPGQTRIVQYFDKSRMEITDPDATDDGIWYVTNGLLVVEMMTGQIQTGDNRFDQHAPSEENVAGDPGAGSGPTYAALSRLRNIAPATDGETLTTRVDRAGKLSDDLALATFGVTAAYRITVPNIDHQVASVFWEFMNASAPVFENGELVTDRLFQNPFYATGYPITEAYWTTVAVGGAERDVLLQCFERRCLTYTPDNPAGWQVEAGNVGQHYYRWRYGDSVPGQ